MMEIMLSMDNLLSTLKIGWILRLRSGQALPYGKDFLFIRPTRSQTPVLSMAEEPVLSP